MVLSPRDSGKFINSFAEHVTIENEGIISLGQKILEETINGKINLEVFSKNEIHPSADSSHAADWFFVVDSLNFCFWNIKGRWAVEKHHGYFALCAAINRAIKEKIDILNPEFYAEITFNQLKKILRSDTKISVPLIEERVKNLHESGKILLENFGGSFINCIRSANGSALKLLEIIVESFPHFRDSCKYKNQLVSFYKRAQILVADIWCCFQGKGLGYFHDIDKLTMFADYRVPQTLLYFGVLKYSNELLDKLENAEIFDYGSHMEVEIRGCTIHATEMLKEFVNNNLPEHEKINSVMLDYYLWNYRRNNAKEIHNKNIHFHYCVCIYY